MIWSCFILEKKHRRRRTQTGPTLQCFYNFSANLHFRFEDHFSDTLFVPVLLKPKKSKELPYTSKHISGFSQNLIYISYIYVVFMVVWIIWQKILREKSNAVEFTENFLQCINLMRTRPCWESSVKKMKSCISWPWSRFHQANNKILICTDTISWLI